MDKLIKIQSQLKAPKGQFNAFGKYKYRSTEDILEALKPLLKENNCTLVIFDDLVMIGDRYYVKALAQIKDNESKEVFAVPAFAREEENKKGMDQSQITGAASSYARKYALNGLFLIDDTKDADSTNDHKDTPIDKLEVTLTPQMEGIWFNALDYLKGGGDIKKITGKYKMTQKHLKKLVEESENG